MTLTRIENHRAISLMNMNTKVLNRILADQIHQHTDRIIHRDQAGFTAGMQDGFKLRGS